jgi:hypothetical protein
MPNVAVPHNDQKSLSDPGAVVENLIHTSTSSMSASTPGIGGSKPHTHTPAHLEALPALDDDYESLPENTSLAANLAAGACAGIMVSLVTFA